MLSVRGPSNTLMPRGTAHQYWAMMQVLLKSSNNTAMIFNLIIALVSQFQQYFVLCKMFQIKVVI